MARWMGWDGIGLKLLPVAGWAAGVMDGTEWCDGWDGKGWPCQAWGEHAGALTLCPYLPLIQ